MVSRCELICLALIIQGDVEHLFMCLLTTGISSLEKYLFKFFAHFLKNGLFVFLMLICKNICDLQVFSLIL